MRGVPENPTATQFRLTCRAADEPHDLSVERFGCVRVVRQAGASEAHLPFPGQGVRLASAEPDGTWLLETLTRNQVPLYLRRRGTDAVDEDPRMDFERRRALLERAGVLHTFSWEGVEVVFISARELRSSILEALGDDPRALLKVSSRWDGA